MSDPQRIYVVVGGRPTRDNRLTINEIEAVLVGLADTYETACVMQNLAGTASEHYIYELELHSMDSLRPAIDRALRRVNRHGLVHVPGPGVLKAAEEADAPATMEEPGE